MIGCGRTLEDVAAYITSLPKKESAAPEWQTGIEILIRTAERGRPTIMAHIGMMKAINRPGAAPESQPAPPSPKTPPDDR
jgi:hypothetical protein